MLCLVLRGWQVEPIPAGDARHSFTVDDKQDMPELPEGRSRDYWELRDLERQLDESLVQIALRDGGARNVRRAADGATYRRLAGDVLEPARLERPVPLSRFAAAALPDPERLHSNHDWVGEVYGCPADVVELRGGLEGLVRLLQRAGDELLLLSTGLSVPPRSTRYFHDVYRPALAAVDTKTGAEGKEFVPTSLSGRALERIGASLTMAELFEIVAMPANPYRLAGFTVTPGRPFLHAEQTADTSQTTIGFVTPGTRDVELTAVKIAALCLVSSEADEDVLAPLLAAIETELGEWLAAGVDDAIVNGDAQGAHMDSDITAAADARKAWDGLRALTPAAAKTDGANAPLTASMLRANRRKLGRAGALARQLAHIVSPVGVEQLASDNAFVTPERYGPSVTPVAGEAGRVDGVPVVVSDFVRDDLNASGVHDGATENRTVAITVNRNGFVVGQRRGVSIGQLTERLAESDQRGLTASLRLAFASRQPAGSEPVALTYNVSTSG